MDKKLIQEKLKNLQEFEQQEKLKEIVDDVFYNLVEHQNEEIEKLNQRVFEEVKTQEEYYDIHTTIVKRENIDLVNGYLFPILEEDAEQIEIDKEEFMEKLEEENTVNMGRIYLSVDYPKVKELKDNERTFSGQLISEEETYDLTIEMRPVQEYIEREEKLYKNFIANNISWRTIYNPWIRRVFDIVIVDYDEEILELEDFDNIEYDLEECEDNTIADVVPVWNIEKVNLNCDGFPIPIKDTVHYEHVISLTEMDQENGYVVSDKNDDVVSVRRTEEDLIITTDQEEAQYWDIYKIIQNKPQTLELNYPLKKNSRKKNYINKYAVDRSKVIRTKAEINRLANSFQVLDEIKLKGVEIQKNSSGRKDNYYFNEYIKDEVRLNKYKNTMLLKFKLMQENPFKYDVLSFIVSEIQRYFPDYICKGVLLS